MKKYYVLDTNILFQTCGNALRGFDDNYVILPYVVKEELDRHKHEFAARETFRILREIVSLKGNLVKGVKMENKGTLFLFMDDFEDVDTPSGFDRSKPDNRIIMSTMKLAKLHPKNKVILITNDTNLTIDALALGVEVQNYKNDHVSSEKLYTGRQVILTSADIVNEIYSNKSVDANKIENHEPFEENQFVRVEDYETLSGNRHSALTIYQNGQLNLISGNKKIGCKARNAAQEYAIEMLLNPDIALNLMIGPAGCGKTFLALAVGLYLIQDKCEYSKMYITRTNTIPDGEDLGFLPGDLEEKMGPLLYPFYDNLSVLSEKAQDLIDQGIIEICSMAYIRGRSIKDAFIVVDEAQNMTRIQAKTLVTRAGERTKIVLCGDPNQIDNPRLDYTSNGLIYTAEKMRNQTMVGQLTFTEDECVRSLLSKLAAKLL